MAPPSLWLHGSRFDVETKRSAYQYSEPRCSHRSSLSHAAHGMVAVEVGQLNAALEHFGAAATVDLLNTSHTVVGGTFIGGIHTAACGGTYQLAVQGFGGLGYRYGSLTIDPALAPGWESLSFPIRWRGSRLRVAVSQRQIEIVADPDNAEIVSLLVRGEEVSVANGATVTV